MPESRKRPRHHLPKTSRYSSTAKSKRKITWAILLGFFGLLIAYFAAGPNYIVLILATLIAAIIGYFIGKKMEQKN